MQDRETRARERVFDICLAVGVATKDSAAFAALSSLLYRIALSRDGVGQVLTVFLTRRDHARLMSGDGRLGAFAGG